MILISIFDQRVAKTLQMQGKFQMQILPQAGHAVHEDVPDRVAEVLASFLVRNKFAKPLAAFTPAMPGCWDYLVNNII